MQSLDIVSVLPDIQSASGHLALGLQLRGTAGERTRCGRGCATCMSPAKRCLALQNVVLAPRRPDLDGLVIAAAGELGAGVIRTWGWKGIPGTYRNRPLSAAGLW